jgi:hypothetical protein
MATLLVASLWILVVITAPSYGRAQEFAPAIRPGEHRLSFERLGATRYKHQVDVVRHEAVPHHRHSVQRKTLLQQIKIDAAICIAVENKPARISTLGHVV